MSAPSGPELLGGAADPDAPPDAAKVAEPTSSYVVFRLGQVWYAIPTAAVKEVVPRMEPVELPQTPAFVRGLLNLGGRIVVLLELGSLLGHAPTVPSAHAEASWEIAPRDLVVHVQPALVAFRVDEVSGLTEVPNSRLQRAAGESGSPVVETFLLGDRPVSVLDAARVVMLAESQVEAR